MLPFPHSVDLGAGTFEPWVAALRSELGNVLPGGLVLPEVLGVVAVLDELGLVLDAVALRPRAPSKADLKTLVRDTKQAFSSIGPNSTAALGVYLDMVLSRLGRDAVLIAAPTDTGPLSALRDAVREARDAVVGEDGVRALWRDVVLAYRDEAAAPGTPFLRLRQLREAVEAAGHDFRAVGLTATYELGPKATGGDANEKGPVDGQETRAPDAERRLAIGLSRAEDCFAEQVTRRDVPVWLAFKGASVPDDIQQLGPLWLMESSWLQSKLDEGAQSSFRLQDAGWPELAVLDEARGWFDEAPDSACVFVRVLVLGVSVAAAAARARALVTDLVGIANDASEWHLMQGHLSWDAGSSWDAEPLLDGREVAGASRYLHSAFEPTALRLEEFSDGFIRGVARGDAACVEALEDARWVVTAGKLETASHRIVLGLRAVERMTALDPVHGDYEEKAVRSLFAPWFARELDQLIAAAAFSAYGGSSRSTVRIGRRLWEQLTEVHEVVMPETRRGSRDPAPHGLAELSAAQLDLMPSRSDFGRIARYGHALLNDPVLALQFLDDRERAFRALRVRAHRLRNHVIHERRPPETALTSVDQYVRDLARFAARDAVAAAPTKDHGPLARFEHQRFQLERNRAALERGHRPVDVFFPDASWLDNDGALV